MDRIRFQNLPVTLCVPEKQHKQARRLRDWCYDLDGTVVDMVIVPESYDEEYQKTHSHNWFFSINAQMLINAANRHKETGFIWLEHDSIPLRANWSKILSAQFSAAQRKGKCFLMPELEHPLEMGSGIGVYGPETRWLIPPYYREYSWDKFLYEQLPSLIEWTPLIQHRYINWQTGNPNRFPEDDDWIRPEAVLFHTDKRQSLIGRGRIYRDRTYFHTGDQGDLIAFLSIIHRRGGGEIAVHDDPTGFIRPFTVEKFRFMEPLIAGQPYVCAFTRRKQKESDIDVSNWRSIYTPEKGLIGSQSEFTGMDEPGSEPWLYGFSLRPQGRVVFARSARYREDSFPWKEALKLYQKEAVFVGLPEEHADFVKRVGKVPFHPCKTALDMAELMAGANLFVGNQSLPFWIAAGLGVPTIQETKKDKADAVIKRDAAQYSNDTEEIHFPHL